MLFRSFERKTQFFDIAARAVMENDYFDVLQDIIPEKTTIGNILAKTQPTNKTTFSL